jgi:hypothetical protein
MSRIGTKSARTRHRFAGIVHGEGGGTTPRPWVGKTGPSGAALRGEGTA